MAMMDEPRQKRNLIPLKKRADQGQWSVPFVDYRVTFEMRQLQFDDIAVPRLSLLDLLMVAKGRERSVEAMGAMFGLGVDPQHTQPMTERSAGQRSVLSASEHVAPISGNLLHVPQDREGLPRQRHDMVPSGFHLCRRYGPSFGIPIDFSPFHVVDHAGARNRQCIDPKGITDHVAKSGLLPWRHDQSEETNDILRLSDAGPWCRDVDSELLLAGTERIVAIAFKVGVVANLLTDTVDPIAGL